MIAIMKHELSMFYHGMTAYVFGAFLLMFTGIGAMVYNINSSVANFEYVLGFVSIMFIVLIPILTMRILAEEKKQKTDQLLYSLPMTSAEIILGKFLALAIVYLVPIVIICFYPLLFSRFGSVYLPTSYGSIFAYYVLGLALISMGMFVSSLTESQGMAAGICIAVMIFNYYCASIADYVSKSALSAMIAMLIILVLLGLIIRVLTKTDVLAIGFTVVTVLAAVIAYIVKPTIFESLLPNLMEKISLFERFFTFINGVFDLTAIVYYVSVIVFFLFLCVQSFEKRRYNG